MMTRIHKLGSLIVPFGMSPADEAEAINSALQERGMDASDIISVRATGTPIDGIIVYFRSRFTQRQFAPSRERPQCEHGFFPYGDVPYCPECMAENAQVK